jgi:hypothetical protein
VAHLEREVEEMRFTGEEPPHEFHKESSEGNRLSREGNRLMCQRSDIGALETTRDGRSF